jgi:hypothetical protein
MIEQVGHKRGLSRTRTSEEVNYDCIFLIITHYKTCCILFLSFVINSDIQFIEFIRCK